MKGGTVKATEGRYIGGGRDQSAPAVTLFMLSKPIIGDGRDQSAPTGVCGHLLISIDDLW